MKYEDLKINSYYVLSTKAVKNNYLLKLLHKDHNTLYWAEINLLHSSTAKIVFSNVDIKKFKEIIDSYYTITEIGDLKMFKVLTLDKSFLDSMKELEAITK